MAPKQKKKAKAKPLVIDKEKVREYANELKQSRDRQLICVHIVNILTKQHGGAFPVALNSGTRPKTIQYLNKFLGESLYAELCPGAKHAKDLSVDSVYPNLPSSPPTPTKSLTPEEKNTMKKDLQEKLNNTSLQELLHNGAVVIPRLMNEIQVAELLSSLEQMCLDKGSPKTLTVVIGNGNHGAYNNIGKPTGLLAVISDATKSWIQSKVKPDKMEKKIGKNAIVLRYGNGGINYAHHDSSGDFQALLMLSDSGVDYTGGEFYLARGEKGKDKWQKTDYPLTSGDLIVFRGNRGKAHYDFLHGMNEVKPGSAPETRRFAVGFFQ